MKSLYLPFIILVLFLGCQTRQNDQITIDEYDGYTLEEAREFHQQFVTEYWLKGGDLTRYIFLNYSEFWPHKVISRAGPIRELPYDLQEDIANFITDTDQGQIKLKDYVRRPTVDGIVVLHKGRIVFEDYPNMFPYDKHTCFSTFKPFVSTLIAILEDEGKIDVSKSSDAYIPELEGTDWGSIPVIDILDMCAGMCYDNSESGCLSKFALNSSGWPGFENSRGKQLELLRTEKKSRPSGEIYEYSSVNTTVLGWIVERITGVSGVDLIEREIWQKMGAESDGLMFLKDDVEAQYMGGLSATLRDLARFGLLFTPTGRQDPYDIISEEYLQKIQKGGRPEILAATGPIDLYAFDDPKTKEHLVDGEPASHATYQWEYVMKDGDFFKAGYAGQGLYISPKRDLVIAYFGTFEENQEINQLPRIARQLAKSGLFDD